MEEVQKNENGTTVPQADGKPKKEDKPKRELTPQQVQQRRKMIVFPLMFLAFAGCMYLIFAPSGKEDVNVESVGGFNADIPLPAEDGIIADKQKAYEQAVTSRKQQDKIQSLQDFGFTLDDDTEEPQEEINLMPEEDPKPQRGGGASSRAAYRDINRQLSTFYETPPVDEEKEELKRQVAELTDRLKQQQNATPTADDQMALLEKSYELAAKYMNGQDGQRGQIAQIPTAGQNGGGIGTPAIPVQAIRETTVSGLQQPMSDADFIRAYSQPRNYGFNTAVGTGYAMGKNTVAACIHQDQTLVDGQAVKLRLLEPMQAGNIVVPKNTLVAGTAKVQGERLDILVSSIEYAGNIIPVELAVFDTDGQKGLSVPSSMEQEAFNEAMANIGSGLGTSISFAQSAGQQVAMDVTRGLLQGTSGYLAKKFRTVKVKLKQIFGLFALLLGVCAANAQTADTVKYAAGNDLYRGITRKLPYRQMVTPYGVEVTFAKTVHIIFPAAVRYVDLGSNHIIAGKADGAENVIRVKATTEGFPGETNFSVICEDGSFFSFNAKYAREPEMLNIEMKDFLENEDTSDFSHTRMNIHFRELAGESPLLVKLIMQSIYKNNDRKVRHLGSKRFGIQFLIKGIYTYNGMLYVHTQTKNSSNVPFDTDFIRFKITDKKVPKRTAIQETVLDAVRSYNEVIEIAGKSTVRTVYALPKFTIPDDKLLVVELYEKNGGRHQTIRVENADIVNAEVIDELKIK